MEEKTVQIYPAKVRIVPNCKLAKVTANLTENKFQKMIGGNNRKIVEKKNHKKHGEIITTYTISNAEGYNNTDPLTIFDYAVLSVCISEIAEGNPCTTPAIILRGLTGKDNRENGNGKIHKEQRAAIMESINKLKGTIITIDNSEVNKAFGYNDGKEETITDNILSCRFVTTKINGQIVEDAIYFNFDFDTQSLIQSPIFKVAEQRKQIIRYDTDLLDVPHQNNTPLVIALKNYVILRVMEIKAHKMTPTLTLADIFKKARITEKDRKEKLRARNYIEEFFRHLQSKGVIKNFGWTKKGNQFYSVNFTY